MATQATIAPHATQKSPSQAQNGSPTMKLLPFSSPVPWPIQTSPVAMRSTDPIVRFRRAMPPPGAILPA